MDRWNKRPIINSIIDILIDNKGEALDKRIEELLRKEYPYINSYNLEEIFMKMESNNIITVFRVSKSKNMIVFNKDNSIINQKEGSDST
ncbi:MAG: hypothetical protein JXA99_13710 [Candidatus Lokiarchaeota archaeon]|nr:hypothetical protein [Candidatus Lokiarchaeota archaeon]